MWYVISEAVYKSLPNWMEAAFFCSVLASGFWGFFGGGVEINNCLNKLLVVEFVLCNFESEIVSPLWTLLAWFSLIPLGVGCDCHLYWGFGVFVCVWVSYVSIFSFVCFLWIEKLVDSSKVSFGFYLLFWPVGRPEIILVVLVHGPIHIFLYLDSFFLSDASSAF